MSTASKKWMVIINPTSGNGASKRKWPKIKALLEHHGFDFNFAFTEYSEHSKKLVQTSINQDVTHIICVGGDGTLHNIVNGIFSQDKTSASQIYVGVIPIGTGNDWVKTHNISNNIEQAIKIIKKGHVLQQDIGKIIFEDKERPAVYFNNLAGVGFDGFVVSKVKSYKSLGAIAYLFGALISLFQFKNFNSTVILNSDEVSGKTLMILVGLCKYSGGGMQLTSNPNPFDGLLDVSIAQNLGKFEVVSVLPKLFNGKITHYKKVKTFKTDAINITITQENKPFIQADGELIGSGNFKVSVIPKAFSFYA